MTTQTEREASAKDELAERRAAGELPGGKASDKAEQPNAFPGGPGMPTPGQSIVPPGVDAFNNATFMEAGPDIEKLVKKVMKFPEFKDLAGFDAHTVWRKHSKPQRAGQPVLASTEIAPLIWRFLTEGACGAFAIVLHWQHFDDFRGESQFVHPETLERHIHSALMALVVSEELSLSKQAPTVQAFPETVKRYGLHDQPLIALQQAFKLWEGEPDK